VGGAPAIPVEVEATPSSPLVLIVDDHHENRDLCAALLMREGFRVATAINGLGGLVRAMTLLPDVIVMDLAMPDLDGWDCTRQLRLSPSTRDIPVIVLTAHVTPEARARAFAAGCRAFLGKPFTPSSLIAEIVRLSRPPVAELPDR
jgi:two-component system, cell cycle response regulator DivK